MSIHLHIDEPT